MSDTAVSLVPLDGVVAESSADNVGKKASLPTVGDEYFRLGMRLLLCGLSLLLRYRQHRLSDVLASQLDLECLL
jgi:hypothetical protein